MLTIDKKIDIIVTLYYVIFPAESQKGSKEQKIFYILKMWGNIFQIF